MSVGKLLLVAGGVLALLGLLAISADKLGVKLFRLPGDLVWRGKNSTVYFPLATSLLLSAAATLLLWLLNRR